MTNRITGTIWGRRLIAGMMTWLIPFLVAVPLYGSNGTLLIEETLFKSLMIIIATLCAAVLMIWVFAVVHESYAREAAITGAVWLVMNWGLDLIVLVGLLGTPMGEYIVAIGLRYLMIPIMVITAGIIADRALERTGN